MENKFSKVFPADVTDASVRSLDEARRRTENVEERANWLVELHSHISDDLVFDADYHGFFDLTKSEWMEVLEFLKEIIKKRKKGIEK